MTRRIAGLDLNGWHDFACRGWPIESEIMEESEPYEGAQADRDGEFLVDGGHASVIVSDGDLRVGGPQAILSPIGRGKGWGQIGAPEKRRRLADELDGALTGEPSFNFGPDLRAACDALVPHAQEVMLCIPDRPEMSEARQEAVLAALSGPKRPRATLLWRSVALVLDWLEGSPSPSAFAGQRVASLIHVSDGVEVQYFTLRALEEEGGILVPERSGPGALHAQSIGLRALRDAIGTQLLHAREATGAPPTGYIRLADDIALREPPGPGIEIIRNDRGRWERLLGTGASGLDAALSKRDPIQVRADLVLLCTPLAARHRSRLAPHLDTGGVPVHTMPPSSPARGALRAARRVARGVAHYLDRLDQISLAVLRRGEPAFEDLIPPGAVVAGNREYVSPVISQMLWSRGMDRARFFIRKGEKQIRRWEIENVPAPDENEGLAISLRQRPAQGWARITITAPDWDYLRRNPISLYWSTLIPDARDEAEILNELRPPLPAVPARIHYLAGLSLWDNSFSMNGLSSLLARGTANLRPMLAALRRRDTRDGQIRMAIGSDGALPQGLPARDVMALDRLRDEVARRLLNDVRARKPSTSNDELLFLTWLQGRCPPQVVRELIRAAEALLAEIAHPWLVPMASAKVVLHGVGRVVSAEEDLRRLIPPLAEKVARVAAFNDVLAALAALLARPLDAPDALDRLRVDRIAGCLVLVLNRLSTIRQSSGRTKYALMAIAGLLRVREKKPWALVCDRSEPARALALGVERVRQDASSRGDAKISASAAELLKILHGDGGRTDIIVMIDEIDED